MPNRILKTIALTSRKLNSLSEAAESLWFRLLLCVDDYGRFHADPSIVASAAYPLKNGFSLVKVEARLQELEKAGLIVFYQKGIDQYLYFTNWDKGNIRTMKSKFPESDIACEQLLADDSECKQMPPYSYSESKTDAETEHMSEKIVPKDILDAYHRLCPSLPRVRELTKSRQDQVLVRLKEHTALSWWEEVFVKTEATPFCKGINDHKWKADFDWFMVNDKNAVKVLEGKYEDEEEPHKPIAPVNLSKLQMRG